MDEIKPEHESLLKHGDATSFSPKIKNRILVVCLISLALANMIILNLTAFLPVFVESNAWSNSSDYTLSSMDTALMLAMFSVAQIIFSPINGMIKNMIGTKNSMTIGYLLITITTFGIGVCANISDPLLFKYVVCALRFF